MGTILFLLFLLSFIAAFVVPVVKHLNDTDSKFNFIPSLALALLSILPLLLFVGYSPVDQGNVGVVTRMGRVTGLVQPGPHFVTPFVAHVDQISIKTLTVKPDEDASSLDLQQVHTQVTLAYHFDGAHMDYIYSNLIDSSPNSVENKVVIPAILEAIKASTAKYSVQQLVEQRAKVRDDIEAMVKARISQYYIVAENVSITDFRFSAEFEKSIEQKQVAQQSAEKASNDLQRIKIEAEQKVAAAQGEASALKAQKEQITGELLQLRMIEMLQSKWDGHLPENYYGGNAPLPIVEALKGTKNQDKK